MNMQSVPARSGRVLSVTITHFSVQTLPHNSTTHLLLPPDVKTTDLPDAIYCLTTIDSQGHKGYVTKSLTITFPL
jgi:hypothetical protein